MKRKLILTFTLIVMVTLLSAMRSALPAYATDDNDVKQKLQTYMDALNKNKNFHGSVLVAKDGNILLQKGYGMADIKNNIQIDENTRFAIGSITKQFTAMAIMQLYEKGKLSLDDNISKYISGITAGDSITIHELLTHTSGLIRDIPWQSDKNVTINDGMKAAKYLTMVANPGEKYSYSNAGYILLTYVVEKVSGMSYDEYLDKNILKPLGMNDTGDCYQDGKCVLKTIGYHGFLESEPETNFDIKFDFGAGELYSTTGDLYKWDRALYTDKLLKKENMKKMFTGYVNLGGVAYYGYGFEVGKTPYGNLTQHTGATASFTSIMSRYVDKDTVIIALVNNADYNVTSLQNVLSNIVFGSEYKMPEEKPAEIDYKNINCKDYIGSYALSVGGKVVITEEEGRLYAQIYVGRLKELEIFPESKSKFFCKGADAEFQFDFDKDNKATGFSLILNNNNIVGARQNGKSSVITPVKADESILNSYAGKYRTEKEPDITVSIKNGHLYMQAEGQSLFEILPATETKFYSKGAPLEVDFIKAVDGTTAGLTLKEGGMEWQLQIVK